MTYPHVYWLELFLRSITGMMSIMLEEKGVRVDTLCPLGS